jgi:hypothetical protein
MYQPLQQQPANQPVTRYGPPPLCWNPQGVYDWLEDPKAANGPAKTKIYPYFYAIPGLGALLLFAGIFLPWFSIEFFGTSISVNGAGLSNLPPEFATAGYGSLANPTNPAPLSSLSPDQPFQPWHGWLLLALAASTIAMVALGIFLKNRHFAIATIGTGLFASGLLGYDFIGTLQMIGKTYKTAGITSEFAASSGLHMTVGFGLYIGLAASLAIFIGSLLIFFLFDRI